MGASIQSDSPVPVDAQTRAEYVEFACCLARLGSRTVYTRRGGYQCLLGVLHGVQRFRADGNERETNLKRSAVGFRLRA